MTGSSDTAPIPLIVVALQSGRDANGGISSLGEILAAMKTYRAVVITNRESSATRRWQEQGIEVQIVREDASRGFRRAPIAGLASYWRYFRAVRSAMKRTGARILHANDPLAFQLALPAVRTIRGARILLNMRDTLAPHRKPPRLRYRTLFGQADHVLFLSRDMLARWAELVPDVGRRASVTYSIVDLDRFGPRPLSGELPRIVLVSGVLSPKKGQLDFLSTVAPALAARGIECWLSGDAGGAEDDYAQKCRDAAAALGDRVRLLGYRTDMDALIARAHVVCISSHYEGLMRTMIEAMAAGRPVVSTDVSSAREMLEVPGARAGAVYPVGCSEQMAEAIIALVEDEAANSAMGAEGTRIAHRLFAAETVVAAYEDAYAALDRRRE